MFLALLLPLLAPAHAEPYALAEAGITLNLPAGWEMTRWSDWDFRGKHSAGMALEVWYSPWQLPLDGSLGPALQKQYADHLEEQRAGEVTVTPGSSPVTMGEVEVISTAMRFKFDRTGPNGVAYAAAFPAEGKLMHIVVYAPASNAARASSAVEALVSRLSIEKPPADLTATTGPQTSPLGFTVALPAGWRVPLESERSEALALVKETPISKPKDCFVAAHPDMNGAASAMFLCQESWRLGILDEYSFEEEGGRLKDLIFAKAAAAIPAPDPVETKDRMGVVFRPSTKDHDLSMGVLPYDRGQVVAWVVGPSGTSEALENTLRKTFTDLTFAGPDNGKPPYGPGEWVVHTLTYRPFHPAVLLCVGIALLFVGGLGFLVFRGGKKPQTVGY